MTAQLAPVTPPVFRFAPSPNGYLHLGHAFSALLNAQMAQASGGRFLLRIEDIDIGRCRPEFDAAIAEDLTWLGLTWEKPVMRQSARFGLYAEAVEGLKARGLVYPCFCSRKEIATAAAAREAADGRWWPRDPEGAPLYPGTCRALARDEAARRMAAAEPHAWRLAMDAAQREAGQKLTFVRFEAGGAEEAVVAAPGRWGDVVLSRKDVPTSYHLAVVIDDAAQDVSHVVRGADLLAATDVHRLLQALLALPVPRYHHHRLVNDAAGLKLSKRAGSRALRDLRAVGVGAREIRRSLGF